MSCDEVSLLLKSFSQNISSRKLHEMEILSGTGIHHLFVGLT